MENGKYCIAIMSVGSGVGQSVVTSCNLSRLPIKTIGLGMNQMAFGAYECDVLDNIPIIYSMDYMPALIEKCIKYKVDLIIPGSDDEALILAEHKPLLIEKGVSILVADADFISLTRDKAKMYAKLSLVADIFSNSYNREEVKSLIFNQKIEFPLIAKPKAGYGSKGIEILLDEKDLARITNEHIIQELAIPQKGDPFRKLYLSQIMKKQNLQVAEISIQVLTSKNGEVIGKMASYNKLNDGIPIEVIPYENNYIWSEIDKLLPNLKELGLKGPLNIQGRLTDQGLKIFEMNARFTGLSGLRAIMGFNEVEACIKDWLDLSSENEDLKINYDRFGIRKTTDKVISYSKNMEIKKLAKKINKRVLKNNKTILVTGASGYLGKLLVEILVTMGHEVWPLSRDIMKLKTIYHNFKRVTCYTNNDLIEGKLRMGLVDTIIHCGFAKSHQDNIEISDSLCFTNDLFSLAALHQIPNVINISSQSVYGTKQIAFFTEKTPVIPETFYAQAKYCTELMACNMKIKNRHTNVTSIRLSSLAGGQSSLLPIEILSKFVHGVLKNEPIKIIDGTQRVQRMDVRDAAEGISLLLKTNSDGWETVYNLGIEGNYTIMEMANAVAIIAKETAGIDVEVIYKDDLIGLNLGMDSSKFYSLVNWKPKYTLLDTVKSLFDYYIANKEIRS